MPPTYLILTAIKYFLKSLTKPKTILICPCWPSAPFWPLLASGHNTYFPFVKYVYLTGNPAACIKLGDNKKSILGHLPTKAISLQLNIAISLLFQAI